MPKVKWTKELCLLEAQILKLGTQVEGLIKFGGYREMRIFTNEELAIAEDLLKQAGGV